MHNHESEQMTYVLQGALKFLIGGEEITVREGEVLHIPSWVEHQAEALDDTFELDLFSPIRQDWLDHTDTYLHENSECSIFKASAPLSAPPARAWAAPRRRRWRGRAPGVAICARRRRSARQTATANIQKAAPARTIVPILADLSNAEDVARLVSEATRQLGGIDILINNTGGPQSGPFHVLLDEADLATRRSTRC